MNVDVLNRSGIQAATTSKLAIADCDIHPRPAGVGIGGVSKSLYPYLSKRWQEHVETIGVRYRQPWQRAAGPGTVRCDEDLFWLSAGNRPGRGGPAD